MQLFGCPGKLSFPGHRKEHFQLREIHTNLP
jgi:hypothetical protein